MNNKLKPVRCRCGGEAKTVLNEFYNYLTHCLVCGMSTRAFDTEAEAIEAWNTAMGAKDTNVPDKERTTRVECIAEVYKNEIVDHYLSGICGICGESTYDRAKYCSECGAKLDWSEDE